MLETPSNLIRTSPERDGTEVCSSTSLLSHSPIFPNHWEERFPSATKTRLPTPSPCLLSSLPWFLPGDLPSKIPRLAAQTAVALDCASITSPCLIQGMEPNILARTDSGSPLRAGHASKECRVSVKSTPPAMKANRVSSSRPEASHVALAGFNRDRTSQANCCSQSSHVPL